MAGGNGACVPIFHSNVFIWQTQAYAHVPMYPRTRARNEFLWDVPCQAELIFWCLFVHVLRRSQFVSVACVTICDYFGDLKDSLDPFFFERVSCMILIHIGGCMITRLSLPHTHTTVPTPPYPLACCHQPGFTPLRLLCVAPSS